MMHYRCEKTRDWETTVTTDKNNVERLLIILALAMSSGISGPAIGKCTLAKIADLPVTMRGLKPLITAQINGADAEFVADSGAFYSTISPATAAQFKLKLLAAPFGLRMVGIGNGEVNLSLAVVKVFTLAGVPLPNIEFLVGGSETGSDSVGVLGQNVCFDWAMPNMISPTGSFD